MKKIIFVIILILGIVGSLSVFAHVAEEAEGKIILEKLKSGELDCGNLSESDFEAVGEYFMGQMAGNSHQAMNKMMTQMMGKEGEEKMHVVTGKRMSGCDLNVQMPQNMMSMMNIMRGGNLIKEKGWYIFNWIFVIIVWILLILGAAVLIKWFLKQLKK